MACLNHLLISFASLRNTYVIHAKTSVTEIWLHLSMSHFAVLGYRRQFLQEPSDVP